MLIQYEHPVNYPVFIYESTYFMLITFYILFILAHKCKKQEYWAFFFNRINTPIL